jgi:hypothetical protein
MAMNPRSIELVSMTNVNLCKIDTNHFQPIIRGPFKARKYTFNAITDVQSDIFCDMLLLSDAFLHAQTVILCLKTSQLLD